MCFVFNIKKGGCETNDLGDESDKKAKSYFGYFVSFCHFVKNREQKDKKYYLFDTYGYEKWFGGGRVYFFVFGELVCKKKCNA